MEYECDVVVASVQQRIYYCTAAGAAIKQAVESGEDHCCRSYASNTMVYGFLIHRDDVAFASSSAGTVHQGAAERG